MMSIKDSFFVFCYVLFFTASANAALNPYGGYSGTDYTNSYPGYAQMPNSGQAYRSQKREVSVKSEANNYFGLRGIFGSVNHGYTIEGEDMDDSTASGAQMGAELNFGVAVTDGFKIQFDYGMLSNYDNEDVGKESEASGVFGIKRVSESESYITAQGIITLGGIYIGAGGGLLELKTQFVSHVTSERTQMLPVGVVMAGYEMDLGDNWSLDLGAKVLAYNGGEVQYETMVDVKNDLGGYDTVLLDLNVGTGFTWNAVLGVGIRRRF